MMEIFRNEMSTGPNVQQNMWTFYTKLEWIKRKPSEVVHVATTTLTGRRNTRRLWREVNEMSRRRRRKTGREAWTDIRA